jgi:hypothetical protein
MIVSYIVDYQATIKKKRFIKQPFVSSFFLYQDHSDKILNITVDGQEYSIFLPIYLTEEEIELEMLNLMWVTATTTTKYSPLNVNISYKSKNI